MWSEGVGLKRVGKPKLLDLWGLTLTSPGSVEKCEKFAMLKFRQLQIITGRARFLSTAQRYIA